jgi:succinate dehydrogenase / fumarate reductase membrane anchor subunit
MNNKGFYWLLHICAGVVLIVLLGLHMIIMHLNDIISSVRGVHFEPLSFCSVLERGESIYFLIFYLIFLIIAIYHGLFGLKNVLVEIFYSEKAESKINMFIWISGIILFVVGSLSTVKFFTM